MVRIVVNLTYIKLSLYALQWFTRRLDYFVLSQLLLPQLCDCVMKKHITGSDHCPLVLLLATKNLVGENETWQHDNKITFMHFYHCTVDSIYKIVNTWPSHMNYNVHSKTISYKWTLSALYVSIKILYFVCLAHGDTKWYHLEPNRQ